MEKDQQRIHDDLADARECLAYLEGLRKPETDEDTAEDEMRRRGAVEDVKSRIKELEEEWDECAENDGGLQADPGGSG